MASTMLHEKCCNTVLQIGAPYLLLLSEVLFEMTLCKPALETETRQRLAR